MLKRLFSARAAALVLALTWTPVSLRSALAQCPTNTMNACSSSQLSSSYSGSLAGSYTCTEGGNIHQTATASVAYNLVTGWVEATVNANSLCGGGSDLLTHDTFTLLGPAGPPLSFTANLSACVTVFQGAAAGVTVREGDSNVSPPSTIPPPGPFGGSTACSVVGVTITLSPGSTFDLYMSAGSGGGGGGRIGNASVDAWLGFPDLPPGYLVRSCQGFVAGPPIAVRAASWGRLKTLYR